MKAKYPTTPHLPFSPGLQNDDRRIQTLAGFEGREIVVTEKMDGENTTMGIDYIHARSLDSRHHPSRDWVKKFWGEINYLILQDWRICMPNILLVMTIYLLISMGFLSGMKTMQLYLGMKLS